MTAHSQIARSKSSVKAHVLSFVETQLDVLLEEVDELTCRAREMAVWKLLCAMGAEDDQVGPSLGAALRVP